MKFNLFQNKKNKSSIIPSEAEENSYPFPQRQDLNQQTDSAIPSFSLETIQAEKHFQKIKNGLHQNILDQLDLSQIAKQTDAELKQQVEQLAQRLINIHQDKVQGLDQERLLAELIHESFGLGPLETLFQDPAVSDILVNGPHEVYIEKEGKLEETSVLFANDEHLMQIIRRIVARVGRRIDEHSPMVDARLPDGSRVNAIIPPLSLHGPILSIRRFGSTPLQMKQLLELGSICPNILTLIEAAVTGKINILISGGTGAGKTTLLNNFSSFIPAEDRLVTIEDSAELILQKKHVVSLETRPASAEGIGQVTQRELMINALRMRPDRIILGEVRGQEALDMLQAMNTGHEGSLSTIHANDTDDALSRLEVMVSMSGFDLPINVVKRYITSAITLVVHVARLKGGIRRIMRVSELTNVENDNYLLNDLFLFKQTGIDEQGEAAGHFYATGNKPQFLPRLHEAGIEISEEIFNQGIIS